MTTHENPHRAGGRLPSWLAASTLWIVACRSTPPAESSVSPPEVAASGSASAAASAPAAAPEPPEVRAIPAGWDSKSARAFDRAVASWVAPGERVLLAPGDIDALARALEQRDATAVRAAVLLARSGDPDAGNALLVELERRIAPDTSREEDDAADVVAARGFAYDAVAPNAPARLLSLCVGARPHPDIEVRVECAASALALGRDRVIPFLLKILREGTPMRTRKPDWTRKDDMDWAQWRASEALALRAGIVTTYDPRGSIESRLVESARFEELLAPKKKP